jgi:hypothetical protein
LRVEARRPGAGRCHGVFVRLPDMQQPDKL